MMVVIAHIEAHKVDFGFGRFTPLNLVSMGRMGVTLLFVLIRKLFSDNKETFCQD